MNKDFWKSIRALRWDSLYDDLKGWHKGGKVPKKGSDSGLARFKRVAKEFELDGDDLVLITDVPTPEMASLGFTKAQEPTRYIVVDPKKKDTFVKDVFNNVLAGGFKGVESVYKKIASQYIGISRNDVASVLSRMELKQLKRPILAREIKPITTSSPMEFWQMDLLANWATRSSTTTFGLY